jgi:hypothetical protein
MPIKPSNQKKYLPVPYKGFKGKRLQDQKNDYEYYNSSPQTYKTDREYPKKTDREYPKKTDREPVKKKRNN